MTRNRMHSGLLALFALAGLLSLHTLPNFSDSAIRYSTDACIALVLLGFGNQIMSVSALIWILFIRKANLFVQRIADYKRAKNWPEKRGMQTENTQTKGTALKTVVWVSLLVVAGTLSPSDGVDSGRHLLASDLLLRALIILLVGLGCFIGYVFWPRNQAG